MNGDLSNSGRWSSQRGQTFIAFAIFICLFLVGALGLVTDYSQLLAHRQMAQGAADAACQAGAADLFLQYNSPTPPSGLSYSWFSSGASFDCSTNASSAPCQYASFNGYSGSSVAVSFPSTFTGAPSLSGFTVSHPFIRVTITDQVPMSFTRVVGNSSTQPVTATAYCGMNPVSTPGSLPMLVLDPTDSHTLVWSGSAGITIYSGASPAIVVNSSSTSALQAGGTIDLSNAGLDGTGANMVVAGNDTEPTVPSQLNLGASGKWISPSSSTANPWLSIPLPSEPASAGTATPVQFATDGCPDPGGCVEFTAGDYSNCTVPNAGIQPGGNFCLQLKSNTLMFSSSTTWTASHSYAVNSWIQPTSAQGNAGGFVYKAIQGGTSGPPLPNWQPSHAYAKNTWIQPVSNNNGAFIFEVVTAGTSANGTTQPQPHWPQAVGTQITDGTVTWQAFAMWPQNVGNTASDPPSGGAGAVIWQAYPIKPVTGIFAPGLYYIGSATSNALDVENNGVTAAMSTAAGDGSNGITFYFNGGNSTLKMNSTPTSTACTGLSAISGVGTPAGCGVFKYTTSGNSTTVPSTWAWAPTGGFVLQSRAMQCPGGPANPGQVPATLTGNILLGPCAGTYGGGSSGRGFVFFQNPSPSVENALQPNLSGPGGLLVSGWMYFHNNKCAGASPTDCTQFTLSGSSGAGSYGVGEIVSDQIILSGSSTFTMILSALDTTTTALRPQLLH